MKCILGQHLKLSHLQLLHCIILIVLVGEEYHVYLEKHHLYLVLMKMIMTCNELDQTPRGILLILRLILGFLSHEIEHAQGGSTLENPEDPVDYNTDWDYSIDKYLDEDEQYQEEAVADEGEGDGEGDQQRGTAFYQQDGVNFRYLSPEVPDYGSVDFENHNRRDSGSSSKSSLDEANSIVDDNQYEDFYKQFPTKLDYQRYYLAEEDLVIGIAGYADRWWKTAIYYFLCIGTLGLPI